VCLPHDPQLVEAAFAELRRIAHTFSMALHDPQLGEDIDPSYDGRLPPCF
jgi:hypothetical protein